MPQEVIFWDILNFFTLTWIAEIQEWVSLEYQITLSFLKIRIQKLSNPDFCHPAGRYHLLIPISLNGFFYYIWIVKAILLIFALYIAALSVYPCYEDDCAGEVCLANETEQSDTHSESPDLCTPFCISACCSLQVLSVANFNSKTDLQNSEIKNSAYTCAFTPLVIVSFWQPPKLAWTIFYWIPLPSSGCGKHFYTFS